MCRYVECRRWFHMALMLIHIFILYHVMREMIYQIITSVRITPTPPNLCPKLCWPKPAYDLFPTQLRKSHMTIIEYIIWDHFIFVSLNCSHPSLPNRKVCQKHPWKWWLFVNCCCCVLACRANINVALPTPHPCIHRVCWGEGMVAVCFCLLFYFVHQLFIIID